MKLTFLGSGSAFCTTNFQSNMLLESSDKKMLFDCGGDIRWSLKEKNVSIMDIETIYISHLHQDHCGGLEYVAFVTYFGKVVRGENKIRLVAQEHVLEDLWKNSLAGGLRSIQLVDCTLNTFFNTEYLQNNGTFIFGNTAFELIQTIHVVADRSFVKSYGLRFRTEKGRVFITSDTQWAPHQLRDFIKTSDIVFHDCETSKFPSGVHAHYEDLVTLPVELKSKIWLYHYNDGPLPNAKADGFLGFVEKGQVFEL